MIAPIVNPTEWHAAPADSNGTCTVCECPTKRLGSGAKQQHRATESGWAKRLRSAQFWREFPIRDNRRRRGGHAGTLQRLQHAAELVAAGATMDAAASVIGINPRSLRRSRKKHREAWESKLRDAQSAQVRKLPMPVATVSAEPSPSPEILDLKPPGQIGGILGHAATCLAGGQTWDRIAANLGVPVETLRHWMRIYSSTWRAETSRATDGALALEAKADKDVADHRAALDLYRQTRGADWVKTLPAGEGLTLLEFFQRIYAPLRLLGKSPRTTVDYETTIGRLCRFAGRQVGVSELTDELIAGHMAAMVAKGRSISTINKHRTNLCTLWRFAHRKKLVSTLPDVDKLREPKREPECWSMEEFGRILQAARQAEGEIGLTPAGDWWEALLLTLYDTAVRISALMLARREHFDPAGGWLKIVAESQKQKADQVFRLHPDTLAAIAKVKVDVSGLVFPWQFDWKRRIDPNAPWRSLHRSYRRILKRAGLPHGKRDLFHKIRRTTATAIADQLGEAAAQSYLGHSCAKVTAAYLDRSKIRGVRGVDVLPRPTLPEVSP